MSRKNDTGKAGEAAACSYLQACGYRILQTNWRFHRYELDIVATDGRELVVVEVKTRATDYLVSPEKSVGPSKIQRIAAATDAYVQKYNVTFPVRFDVISLTQNGSACTVFEHIKDAFFAPVNR
ncbi:MAG: YraN family protein [Tannerella sp.]|jgi:putative endonuclease|nr:YraN family protein [Tannerella sp.]